MAQCVIFLVNTKTILLRDCLTVGFLLHFVGDSLIYLEINIFLWKMLTSVGFVHNQVTVNLQIFQPMGKSG